MEAALVRLWQAGAPLGAGFLAGPREVLTAAHVVAEVLGIPADGPPPEDGARLEVDFPLLDPDRRIPAIVVAWSPVDAMMRGDIAGLRLLESPPEGATPLVLIRSDRISSDQLIMAGFPRGLELGSWVYGRRGGRVATGWVEIYSEPGREATLDPGFSGSPVWAPELDAAIGMVARRVRGAPPKIGYLITVDTLLSAWPELAEVVERRPPFRALRPFTEQDTELFFGREEEAERLTRLVHTHTRPVVCVVGPSGVGKSSLLHAGVMPLLRAAPGQVVTVLRPTDGSTPMHALAAAFDGLINPFSARQRARIAAILNGEDVAPDSPTNNRLDRIDELVHRLMSGGVADVVATVLARQGGDRLLVAVDQFEEIFDVPESAQAAFTEVLRATLRPGARWSVLLNLRDTFLGACLRSPTVIELAAGWNTYTVAGLTTSQLRAAITGPLTLIGTVSYQDGLVDRLLEDVESAPSSLPLLQFTLSELWARRRGGLLRHDAYDYLGGVRGALAGYANDVWAGLAPLARADAARLLVQLMLPVPDSELWVRRTAHRDELDDAQWTIAQRLAGTRLLVLRGAPRPGVELAHESLLEHWQQLRELANAYRDFRAWQENLRQRIGRWTEENQAPRRLLSGLDLREADQWARRQPENLSATELGFVALSRRRRRRRRRVAAFALVVVVVAVLTTYRSTGRQRADLAAADLASKSAQLKQFDSYGASQLALRAYRTDAGVDFGTRPPEGYPGVDRLLPDYTTATVDRSAPTPSTSAGAGGMEEVSQASAVTSGKISADGTRMVTTNSAGQVVLWTIDGDRVRSTPLTDLFNALDFADKVTISRSGRYLAFIHSVFPSFPTDVNAPVDDKGLPKTNPDDYHTCKLTSIATTGTACLVVYDIQAGRVTAAVPLGGVATFVSMISIDPDDQEVAAVLPGSRNRVSAESRQNTVRRWDLRTGREREPLRIPWDSWMIGMWLRPGGASAVLWEIMPDSTGLRAERLALSVVDLDPTPGRRRELAANALESEMSLDGRTVAAIETPADESSFSVTAWDTATGDVTARISGLSSEQSNGWLTLNSNGTALTLSWLSMPDPVVPTDIVNATPTPLSHGLVVWSLPDGERRNVPAHIDSPWTRVIPLTDSIDGPLALTSNGMVGLVLPRAGQEPPLRRMADAVNSPRLNTDDLMDRLCALLADPNTDKAVQRLVPPDASEEPLCPS